MNTPNLLVITGNQTRHQYFAKQLNHHFPLSAVFTEHFTHPKVTFQELEEKESWNQFFISRQNTENQLFRNSSTLPPKNIPEFFDIEAGLLNHNNTLQAIKRFNPNKILIFGTSLLKSTYLNMFPNCIFNLHVGLSQYYRGSSCNFWPIYELKPELLGATVHYVAKGIDDGKIINQDKIILDENDSEFTLMAKTIILGTKLMIDSIGKTSQNISPYSLRQPGKLYLMKDFTPQSVIKVRKLVTSGHLKQKIISSNILRLK